MPQETIPIDLKEVAIETSSFCNQGCVYCPATYYKRKKEFMSLSLFYKIADQIAGYLPDQVNLHGYNEPSLDKDLPARISYLKQRGLRVSISSNGRGLSSTYVQRLSDAGLDSIAIDLPSVKPENYQKVRMVDDLVMILDHLNGLKDNTIFTEIVVLGKMDKRHEDEVVRMMRMFPKQKIVLSPIIDRAGVVPGEYANHVFHERLAGCLTDWPYHRVHITYEGKVLLCCQDYQEKYVAGDLNQDGLDDILHNRRYNELVGKCKGTIESEREFICKRCRVALPLGRSTNEYVYQTFCSGCDLHRKYCQYCLVNQNIHSLSFRFLSKMKRMKRWAEICFRSHS